MAEYLEDVKLIDILICVYLKRVKQLARQSFHLIIQDCADMILKMANSELVIFNHGRKSSMELRAWKAEGTKNTHYDTMFSKLKRIKANWFTNKKLISTTQERYSNIRSIPDSISLRKNTFILLYIYIHHSYCFDLFQFRVCWIDLSNFIQKYNQIIK